MRVARRSRKAVGLLRAVGVLPGLQTCPPVSPARGGEMDTGSEHRELTEERWGSNAGPPPDAANDSPTSASGRQEPPAKGSSLRVLRDLSWIEILGELKCFTASLKPIAMERYRKARRTGVRERVFKKGSVVDEAS